MKKRNPAAVLFLPIITLGIYAIVWYVQTKNEMNSLGTQIPPAWMLFIPIANIVWLWKYSEGVKYVTQERLGSGGTFCLLFFLGVIGMAVIQNKFNLIASS